MQKTGLRELFHEQLSREYLILKELGEGAYGITFLARERHGPKRKVVLKLPNLDVRRDIDDLKNRLVEFNNSLDAELRGMRRLDAVPSAAHVLRPGKCEIVLKGECIPVSYIVHEYVRGEQFRAYLTARSFRKHIHVRRSNRRDPNSIFGGIKDPATYLSLASAIASALAEVHKNEVVHGDLWPDNILMRGKEPVIIDFGQSLLLDSVFLARNELLMSHDYAAPERRDPSRQWSTAADIYSLGGVLFFLATGDPPPTPVQDLEELKQTICQRMKKSNRDLYLANSGIADVTARCLRSNERDRPAFAEAVIEELRIFLAGHSRTPPQISEDVNHLNNAVKVLERRSNQVFTQIASARIRSLTWQFNEMSHGLYTLAGHYENIARGMVELLSLLGNGDSYLTLSVPSFWARVGLGTNGRFLEMNKIAAQNGVRIGRVFHLTPEEAMSEEVLTILKAHLRIVEELKERTPRISTDKESAIAGRQGLYTGVVVIPEWRRTKLDLLNFGVWSKAERNQDVLVVPAYRERGRDVAAVRFWAPSVAKKRIGFAKQQALEFIKESTDIREFLATVNHSNRDRRGRPRELADRRHIVTLEVKAVRGSDVPSETLTAAVADASRNGLCLEVLSVAKGAIPSKGSILRLVGPRPVGAKWTSRLWGVDLKVRWAMCMERGSSLWTIGLSA